MCRAGLLLLLLYCWPQVSPAQLAGLYNIGGGTNEFTSLRHAADSLSQVGISGTVNFLVYPGTYADTLAFGSISGSSVDNWIQFVNADPEQQVLVTSGASSSEAVITCSGTSYLLMTGISIDANGPPGQIALRIEDGAGDITFANAGINGSGSSIDASRAIEVRGLPCTNLIFDDLDISEAAVGIHFSTSGASGSDHIVSNSEFQLVRRGIYLEKQSLSIEHCNFRINASSTSEVNGIVVGAQSAQDSVDIHGCRIHELVTTSGRAVGIEVAVGNNTARTRIYNNFIYDFQNEGSSQTVGIEYNRGECEIAANSILINDSPSSGLSYAIQHTNFNPLASPLLRNNILVNIKQSGTAYCIYVQSPIAGLDSDFNICFGSGASFFVGRFAGQPRSTLADWQSASSGDTESLWGDPQFVSETDLHLATDGGLAHQNGDPISYVLDDIDSELRGSPPDRGADEYSFTAPPEDFAVIELLPECITCPELTNVTTAAVVQNRGSHAQTGVPVRLNYLGIPRAEVYVTLDPLEIDTLDIVWATPLAPTSGELLVEAILAGDPNPGDNTQTLQLAVIGQPLHGVYRIGGTNPDYSTFSSAITDLVNLGMSGAVTFEVAAGTYNENVVIPMVTGLSELSPLSFVKALDAEGPVRIQASTGFGTVVLDNARYVTISGITIEALPPNEIALLLDNTSSYNHITGATIVGSTLNNISFSGVRVRGGGCDGNVFENLTIRDAYFGFRLDGSSADPDSATLIENCRIESSTRAIFSLRQRNCHIRGNEINPGHASSDQPVHGIYVASMAQGDTTFINGNTITGGRSLNNLHGVTISASSGVAMVTNNMITGWEAAGSEQIIGIQVSSGVGNIFHNSLYFPETAGSGDRFGFAVTGANADMDVRNCALEIAECVSRSFCWRFQSGDFTADNNLYFNSCDNDSFFFALSGPDRIETLTDWQTDTGQDLGSFNSAPGFISADDLHCFPYASGPSDVGETIPSVLYDFDGDLRQDPPDIGADEFDYQLPQNDVFARWLATPPLQYASQNSYQYDFVVENVGSQDQVDIPVRLLYNAVLCDEQLVSLTSGDIDTVQLDWTAPVADLEAGLIEVRTELPGDQLPWNDGQMFEIVIAGPPLNGTYQIGGGTSDFASLGSAAYALQVRGVNGPVNIELFPENYSEAVTFNSIPGTSAIHPIAIYPADDDSTSVRITTQSGEAVITLSGATNLELSGLQILAKQSCSGAILLKSGSSDNSIFGCTLLAPDSTNSATFGAAVLVDGCDNNTISSCIIRGAYTGVDFRTLFSGANDSGNEVRDCKILNTRYGIIVDDQDGCIIAGNEIIPGSLSSIAAACYGVFVTSLGSGSVEIYNNWIHGFADGSGNVTNRAVGVFSSPSFGASVSIYNNFICDFASVGSLKVNGLYLSVGTHQVYHNSIFINDTPSSNEIAGILISAGDDNDIRSNIIACEENDTPCYGMFALSGGLTESDYNDIWGSSEMFVAGRIAFDEYPTVADWQTTGFDQNSFSLNPPFVSESDLHIQPLDGTFDNLGDPSLAIVTDIDGEVRGTPPDVGADEFDFFPTPDPPQQLTIFVANDEATLTWLPVQNAQSYRVHASSTPDFTPLELYQIATVTDTFFVDDVSANAKRFYLITADAQNTARSP